LENMMTASPRRSLVAIGTVLAGWLMSDDMRPGQVWVTAAKAEESPAQNGAALPNFGSIVKEQGPAVVNIDVTRHEPGRDQSDADPEANDSEPEFRRRFRPPHGMPGRGTGSGFIVRGDGIVITNAHVVEAAADVTVKLTDRREFKAKVVGTDKATDTAVLKIEATELPTVKLGDPAQSGVGDWVLAIGSPFGFDNTVTAGIISAKSRSLPDENYVPFIQTDVAVNPGNSGGPLFNLKGEVIGINSQIYSHSGGYQGVAFAIPIDVAMKVEQQLLTAGRVSRGRIGVGIQDLDQALAESFGLTKPAGALVSSVPLDGPAAKAGIKPGDVILKVNGVAIQNSGQVPPLIAQLQPGTNVKVVVLRDRSELEIAIRLGELAEQEPMAEGPADAAFGHFGLMVRPVDPATGAQGGVTGGVLVERVSGAAARAGVRPGDVLLAVNGQAVTAPEQLRELAARIEKRAALLIQRGNTRLFIPIEFG
jgi:serine protease Do